MRTLRTIAWTVLAGISLGVAGAIAIIHSGIYNVAADLPHHPVEYWALYKAREHSVARRSRELLPPDDFMAEHRLVRGAVIYEEACALCHLRPGLADTGFRRGLLPTPPDLTRWGRDPGETFWMVKHGVRMTGMPAWGRTYLDDDLWSVVAFLQRLPSLQEEEYRGMLATGKTNPPEPAPAGPEISAARAGER